MAAQRLAPLVLSDDERAELQSLTMRRKTAQALALRARIVLACAEGDQNKEVAAKRGLERRTNGGRRPLWSSAWLSCTMSRAREHRAPLTMPAAEP